MIDNLRRSLCAPACYLALAGGWTLPFASAELWSVFVLATIAIPALLPFLGGIVPRRPGLSKRIHLRSVGGDFKLAAFRIVLLVTFLAHQAWAMSDAIFRTLFRLNVSRRKLLEWVTAAQAQANPRLGLVGFYRNMAGGIVLAVAAAALVAWTAPSSWPVATPFVVLWLLSPAIARWVSLPSASDPRVTPREAQSLRLVARRTWRFFETFVTRAEHMLPPDNFQEEPTPVVAHRTSPTNIGLYLLSVVAARDFGWLGFLETLERLEATLQTMERLERCRGHFYNWYDTRTLQPLDPKYISTVDSGNLAGHLIVLGNACRDLATSPLISPQWIDGVRDALELARETPNDGSASATQEQLHEQLDTITTMLRQEPAGDAKTTSRLTELERQIENVAVMAGTGPEDETPPGTAEAETLVWVKALGSTIRTHQRDFEELMPWAHLLDRDTAFGAPGRDDEGSGASQELKALFSTPMTLSNMSDRCQAAGAVLRRRRIELAALQPTSKDELAELDALVASFESSADAAAALERRVSAVTELARKMSDAMEFKFLFDTERELLSIGYRVAEGSRDPNYYDLLASEARLASFVAIAKGDIPTRHWFRLGRAMTPLGFGLALISWSGSMFEYLMPSLVMRAPAGSLLEQTNRRVVHQQMKYGAARGVPWGTSESAYNVRDLEFTYQYSSFGVPSLGLKQGLSENTVIAPYATALSTMVDPKAAMQNFERLSDAGGRGLYGWYEALDYTKVRLREGTTVAVVRAYMAHHQGMSMIAIANALHDGAMRTRFHAEPIVQATELLLHERMPRDIAVAEPRIEAVEPAGRVGEVAPATLRRFSSPHTSTPRTHLLSNGRYAVMMTAAGSGYSRWQDLAVTRWREDITCDCWGSYVFLRDLHSGKVWSAGYQPSGAEPDHYEVIFSEGRTEIVRHDGTITTTLEVAVSSEDNAEVRRVSVTNLGYQSRDIELTSYAEVVLAPHAADDAHQAFSKLFVETEFVSDAGAILATRRRRSSGDADVWAAHLAVIEGEEVGELQFETDRARFLGRGPGIRRPIAMGGATSLSNTVGAVLDPIFSLRRSVRIPPRTTARIAYWTLVASSREDALDLVDKHREATAFDRAATLAWTQAQVQLHHLGIGVGEAHLFQRLANRVLYGDKTLRPAPEVLKRGGARANLLWLHGISGDLPIVLVRIDEAGGIDLVRQLLVAHEYWRMKQLDVDLVILNERAPSYVQDLQASLEALVAANRPRPKSTGEGVRGGIFVLRADIISIEVCNLLQTAARVVLAGHRGSLSEQVRRVPEPKPSAPAKRPLSTSTASRSVVKRPDLEFFNGIGGFADNAREYMITLDEGRATPAPWVNVVSNGFFGFHTSAEGGGYTWSVNSQQNQISPWSNDPVSDTPGEAIYLRDEDTGEIWTPTARPICEDAESYTARHGQGYSRFEHVSHGISLELLQYVPLDDPIKISRLKITNTSGRSRRLSVTAYVEWVLAATRGSSAPFVVTEVDPATGAIFAQNPWSIDFGHRLAFADLAGRQESWTGDRTEFLGRNGSLDAPAALLSGASLSNKVGAGLDPCCALQARLELKAGGSAELVLLLGETSTKAEAQSVLEKYRAADLEAVFGAVVSFWNETLGKVQVATPDRSMDILLNRWLLYQTLACRLWARAGFYQASGAYGFRDQLQDVLALIVSKPEVAREHLLRAAARQFVEGDVQHWWMPESGRGIRTHVSDDRVWLPYAVAHYIEVTDDVGVLDEIAPFIEGQRLHIEENDAYFQPAISDEQGSLFEHCARALDQSLSLGGHGLPLIGTGDWNDGMSRVGEAGRGESIWLAWFLCITLREFARLADPRSEVERARRWRDHAAKLVEALEGDGWDGEWYRRAYFDDGMPLGSAANEECRIDAIAQSWSVISKSGDPARAARAMAAVEEHLIRRDEKLALLFAPPFDRAAFDPGYIKGYPPGIRENGGQYTHGAIWSVIAFAMLGDGDKAGDLFRLINPINHASTPAAVERYKVEPYVACADVYSTAPHVGRGGWTWYTGSAGWMYRAGLEWMLGFRLRGTTLVLDPCIPKAWPKFKIIFKHGRTTYVILVENPISVSRGVVRAELDGHALPENGAQIPLVDDGTTHLVWVVLG